jgi:short-subunit dehydrogenase
LLINKLKKDKSVIVNIASSVAYNPLPGMATYAASKAFLLNWSLALGEELKATNKVITFSPAGTKTNFQNSAGVKNVDSPSLFDAETVADAIIQAIKKKQMHTIMGIKTNLFILLIRLIPHKYRLALLSQIFEKNR